MELAKFIRENCREPGKPYQFVVEKFSEGKVTKQATPKEYKRRIQALYTARPRIARYVHELSGGTEYLPEKKFGAHGLRRDGKKNHAGIIMVVKVGEVGS